MHIPPFDNKNKPIVDIQDKTVPLNYFNIVKLNKDQVFEYVTPGYETCIVPATGCTAYEILTPLFFKRLAISFTAC